MDDGEAGFSNPTINHFSSCTRLFNLRRVVPAAQAHLRFRRRGQLDMAATDGRNRGRAGATQPMAEHHRVSNLKALHFRVDDAYRDEFYRLADERGLTLV